jgi:hypothetical protein
MEMQASMVDCRSSKTLAYCLFQTHVKARPLVPLIMLPGSAMAASLQDPEWTATSRLHAERDPLCPMLHGGRRLEQRVLPSIDAIRARSSKP